MHIFGLAFILYFLKLSAGKGFDYAVILSLNLDLHCKLENARTKQDTKYSYYLCSVNILTLSN